MIFFSMTGHGLVACCGSGTWTAFLSVLGFLSADAAVILDEVASKSRQKVGGGVERELNAQIQKISSAAMTS